MSSNGSLHENLRTVSAIIMDFACPGVGQHGKNSRLWVTSDMFCAQARHLRALEEKPLVQLNTFWYIRHWFYSNIIMWRYKYDSFYIEFVSLVRKHLCFTMYYACLNANTVVFAMIYECIGKSCDSFYSTPLEYLEQELFLIELFFYKL